MKRQANLYEQCTNMMMKIIFFFLEQQTMWVHKLSAKAKITRPKINVTPRRILVGLS